MKLTEQAPFHQTETEGGTFRDKRHQARLAEVLRVAADHIGETIPAACTGWGETKATYEFLNGDKNGITEWNILSGHFAATGKRIAAEPGMVLVPHDTTDCVFRRSASETDEEGNCKPVYQKNVDGTVKVRTKFCVHLHISYAMTPDGRQLGIASAQVYTREKFGGTAALIRSESPTRLRPGHKESIRWIDGLGQATDLCGDPKKCVHIADRESDSYEFIDAACKKGTNYLIRIKNDRSTDEEMHVSELMKLSAVRGVHLVRVKDKEGNDDVAKLEIRARVVNILPPVRKRKDLEPLVATVIYAEEKGEPKKRERISWKLMTNLPVRSRKHAIKMLDWYALRWKIEVFNKALKSGCNTEGSKLRTAQRLTNLIAINCIVAWRVCKLTMLNRAQPNGPPEEHLTQQEMEILDEQVDDMPGTTGRKTLGDYIIKIAKLGGYLARKSDAPPGNIVMKRGVRVLMLLCYADRGEFKRRRQAATAGGTCRGR